MQRQPSHSDYHEGYDDDRPTIPREAWGPRGERRSEDGERERSLREGFYPRDARGYEHERESSESRRRRAGNGRGYGDRDPRRTDLDDGSYRSSSRESDEWNRSSRAPRPDGRSDGAESWYSGSYRQPQPYSYQGDGMLSSTRRERLGPHVGRGPKGYRRSNDQIVEDVNRHLQRDGEVDASEVEVTCQEGVVTLKGKVSDRQAKRAAENCAEEVDGVEDVMNELRVDKGFFAKLFGSDDESSSSRTTSSGAASKKS